RPHGMSLLVSPQFNKPILGLLRTLPAFAELVADTEMVENARNDCVYQFGDRLWLAVERRTGRDDQRTGFGQRRHVAEVNQIVRCLAWDEDQLAPFLQKHVRRARDRAARQAVR